MSQDISQEGHRKQNNGDCGRLRCACELQTACSSSAFSCRLGLLPCVPHKNAVIQHGAHEFFYEIISIDELGQPIFEPAPKAR